MNIKRGLFRLWVILSVAWIGFIGFTAYDNSGPGYVAPRNIYFKRTFGDGKNPFEKYLDHPLRPLGISKVEGAKSTDYTYSEDGISAESSEVIQQLLSNQLAGNLYKIRLDDYRQFTLYVPTDIDDKERDRQIDKVANVAKRITDLVSAKHRDKVLKDAFVAAIGVPLGFLIVGAGIYWALAGFARPKPD